MEIDIRAIDDHDRDWIRKFILDRWCAEFVVVHAAVYYPHTLGGFVAEATGSKHVGLATYIMENSACELVTLDSLHEGLGIGSALVQAVAQEAARTGCSKVWCITTNDNHLALRFYQKRGFRIVAVHPGAVDRSRALKPSIPLLGVNGIPIRDEIELEFPLLPIPGG
jgi:DNA-3-methyladenine glycosylase I